MQRVAQKFQILRGRPGGLFEPFEQLGSSIRIEDATASYRTISTTALTW